LIQLVILLRRGIWKFKSQFILIIIPLKGKTEISVMSLLPFGSKKETIVVVTDAFSDYAGKTNYFNSYSVKFNILFIKNRGSHQPFEQKARK